MYQTIINLIPPHEVYIEPFLGSGAIMRHMKASTCSIGVDIDLSVIGNFPNICTRAVTLIHGDAISFLKKYAWTGKEFVYCDPPYLLEVRSKKAMIYPYEFSSREDHQRLLSLIKKIPADVMISGYFSSLYQKMLPGWSTTTFPSVTRSGRVAQEWLWMNYSPPDTLHDYRFLGRDFRERERIKRRQHRWERRLVMMKPLERAALLSAIEVLRIPSREKTSAESKKRGDDL